MKIIGKIIERVSDLLEDTLRKLCFRMNRGTRLVILVLMAIISAFGCLLIFAASIYHIGKYKGKQEIQIEHIKSPETFLESDSVNFLNEKTDGTE